MINRIAVLGVLAFTACSQSPDFDKASEVVSAAPESTKEAAGPTLGTATDVVITSRHLIDNGFECTDFKPTVADVTKYLNSARIVINEAWHHGFTHTSCRVEGTAEVGGYSSTWYMQAFGLGSITIASTYTFLVVDESQREQ